MAALARNASVRLVVTSDDRAAGGHARRDATGEVGDVVVAELRERDGAEGGASTGRAVEQHPAVG